MAKSRIFDEFFDEISFSDEQKIAFLVVKSFVTDERTRRCHLSNFSSVVPAFKKRPNLLSSVIGWWQTETKLCVQTKPVRPVFAVQNFLDSTNSSGMRGLQ